VKYQFPNISSLSQIESAIKGRKEFIVAERDDYIVVNYLVAHADTFPKVESYEDSLLRECRGIIFDKNGNLIARRFHKFFNAGEREETQNIDLSGKTPFIALEKLDGSMISPISINNHIRWTTKMGITEIAMDAEVFVADKLNYLDFASVCLATGCTPIFEYISPKNRIVISYVEENLVLTAIRDNFTGNYFSQDAIASLAFPYRIPVVSSITGWSLDSIRDGTGLEGIVLVFEDGHRVKLKSEWYCTIHKAKENLLFEKNVIRLILEEKDDDVYVHLLKEDRDRLNNYKSSLLSSIDDVSGRVENILRENSHLTRKEFAINVAPKLIPLERAVAFSCLDGAEPRTKVINYIHSQASNQNNIDSLRDVLKVKW